MKRTTAVLIVMIVSVVFGASTAHTAKAQTAPYTSYDFTFTNIYSNGVLTYTFSGMTAGDTFTVSLNRLNADASFHSTIEPRECAADGGGNCTLTWLPSLTTWNTETQESFPMRIEDEFGNVLGHHFIAPIPDASWPIVGGGDYDKVCIAGCAYNIEIGGPGGIHHSSDLTVSDKNKILTVSDEYVIVHFRYDIATPDPDDKLQIKNIETGVTVFETLIDELNAYNHGGLAASGGEIQYVVFATNGLTLPVVHEGQIPSWTYDNPFTADFPIAGYSYARVDDGAGDAVFRQGMSVWGVTTDVRRLNWTVDATINPIVETRQNRAQRRAIDQALYDAFPSMALRELLILIDPTDHPYLPFRQTFYNVSALPPMTPSLTLSLNWNLQATDLHYGQTVADFALIPIDEVTIVEAGATLSSGDSIRAALDEHDLRTDVGTLAIWLVLHAVAFFAMWRVGIGVGNSALYALMSVAISGVLIIMEISTPFSAVVMGLASIMGLLAVFVTRRAATA